MRNSSSSSFNHKHAQNYKNCLWVHNAGKLWALETIWHPWLNRGNKIQKSVFWDTLLHTVQCSQLKLFRSKIWTFLGFVSESNPPKILFIFLPTPFLVCLWRFPKKLLNNLMMIILWGCLALLWFYLGLCLLWKIDRAPSTLCCCSWWWSWSCCCWWWWYLSLRWLSLFFHLFFWNFSWLSSR